MTRTVVVLAFGMAAVLPAAAQTPTSLPASEPRDQQALVQTILAIEDQGLAGSDAGLKTLTTIVRDTGSRGASRQARIRALRAIGRAEDRALIPILEELLADPDLRSTAELGLLLTLRAHGAEPQSPPIESAVDRLMTSASPAIVGQLPFVRRDRFVAAETRLREALDQVGGARADAAGGLEALVRRNRRLGPLAAETIDVLRKGATWSLPKMERPADGEIARGSMAALLAAGAVDADLIDAALREDSAEGRRLGALALIAAGTSIDAAQRTKLIERALGDRDATVRYEAIRAWARHETAAHGCGRLVTAFGDASEHVALAAIDALGERCLADGEVTEQLVPLLRTPESNGPWRREAHAIVAMARRAPDKAAPVLPMFKRHQTWQLRMYAARAAALLKDVDTLRTLATDDADNVVEVALPPLRQLTREESDPEILAALKRNDYQLLRSVAVALKGAPPNKAIASALAEALERVTAHERDTSRDTRAALIERIVEQGAAADHSRLFERLVTDYDVRIATEAARIASMLTGRDITPAPRPLRRPSPPTASELLEDAVARVTLDSGRTFDIVFDGEVAPLGSTRFARLVRAKYYDGLTFHRVAPNFVIQGGSPGANEYAGDALYMRDEIGYTSHRAGTVGISTRGRHTGDAQIFVNLVDNRRLDFDYTIIGRVTDMTAVASVVEGTRIRQIRIVPAKR